MKDQKLKRPLDVSTNFGLDSLFSSYFQIF